MSTSKKNTKLNLPITFLLLLLITFSILIPIILIATYYYTYDLVKFLQDNKECSGCMQGDYYCEKILRLTPIPLMVILVFNLIINSLRIKLPLFLGILIGLINMIMYIWFITCLYKNTNYIINTDCGCIKQRKNVVNKLNIVSKVLLTFIIITVVIFILSGILVLFK
jgi:hypothetical protein